MSNESLKNSPYVETDMWGRKWVDSSSNAFLGKISTSSKKQKKKGIKSLKRKGLIVSKRGENNRKLYRIDPYIWDKVREENEIESNFSGLEEFIQDTIALDLVEYVAKEIDNNFSYRLSVII